MEASLFHPSGATRWWVSNFSQEKDRWTRPFRELRTVTIFDIASHASADVLSVRFRKIASDICDFYALFWQKRKLLLQVLMVNYITGFDLCLSHFCKFCGVLTFIGMNFAT